MTANVRTPRATAKAYRLMRLSGDWSGLSGAFTSVSKNALQDTQRREDHDQRAAALTDQRQRDARHRQEPNVHPDVDEHLIQNEGHYSDRDQASERVVGEAG